MREKGDAKALIDRGCLLERSSKSYIQRGLDWNKNETYWTAFWDCLTLEILWITNWLNFDWAIFQNVYFRSRSWCFCLSHWVHSVGFSFGESLKQLCTYSCFWKCRLFHSLGIVFHLESFAQWLRVINEFLVERVQYAIRSEKEKEKEMLRCVFKFDYSAYSKSVQVKRDEWILLVGRKKCAKKLLAEFVMSSKVVSLQSIFWRRTPYSSKFLRPTVGPGVPKVPFHK